jgi:hypothetical protein
MNRFTKSLARKVPHPETPIADDQPGGAESVENVLMPDIYAVKNVDTVPDLEILDLSAPDIDKSAGFNPYDTAILRTKLGPKPR